MELIYLAGFFLSYLSMNKDYRPQQPPRSSLTVHMQHTQDLEKTDASATHNIISAVSSHYSYEHMLKCRRKSLLYLMADVANTWPFDPTPSTMIEAMTTIKSVRKTHKKEGEKKTHNQIRATIIFSLIQKWSLAGIIWDVHLQIYFMACVVLNENKGKSQVHLWLIWVSW